MADSDQPIQSSRKPHSPILTTKNLSIVVTGLILGIALLKADPEDIPKIVEILFGSSIFAAVGWTFAIAFLFGCAIFIRLQERTHQREISRLSKERDELQKKLLKDL